LSFASPHAGTSKAIIKQANGNQLKPIRFPLTLSLTGNLDGICSLHNLGLFQLDADQLLTLGSPYFRLWLTALRGYEIQKISNCVAWDYLHRMNHYASIVNANPSGEAFVTPFSLPSDTPGNMVLDKLHAHCTFNLENYCAQFNLQMPQFALSESSFAGGAL